MRAQSIGKNSKQGFATLEILIAFAVVILCISAVVLVAFSNQSIALDSEASNEAISKAQAGLELARANSRLDFNLVNPSIATEQSGSLAYTKNIDVTQIDLFTKKVTSIVSWQMAGRTLSTMLTTLLTNKEAVAGGDTCSSVPVGDWTNPKIIPPGGYEFGSDILNDTSSGFPITSIQAFNHKMYVTVNNSNGNNPGTFFILDISNPEQKPILLSPTSFDNSTVGEGLNAVAIDGNGYAYVANGYTSASANCVQNHNCAQLQVINIDIPANPVIVKNFKIPSITTGNKLAYGTSIFYRKGIVYLGLAKANNVSNEFYVIDVGGAGSGNPTNPVIMDSAKIDNGINAIYVNGKYAYVASPNDEELKIFDVSRPEDIGEVGRFNAPGGGVNNGNGKSLYLVGDKLYLGRTLLNGDEFYILNNSSPESTLQSLGSKNIQNSGSNTSVNGIIVRDNLAFLITNKEFQIWNISNPSNITPYTNPITLPPGSGQQGTASDCEGNYIFVGSKSSNNKGYISIITSN
ncbi:MAG: hypothetical protein KBC06_00415 [Candidatus Pacebacteria bacterium]|nr:hypothetical protein [Candidatus Paceibacterota bacterium]